MAAMLLSLRFIGVLAGVAFLVWGLGQIPMSQAILSGAGAWPVVAYQVANYFGVTAAMKIYISFIIMRAAINALFTVARMF